MSPDACPSSQDLEAWLRRPTPAADEPLQAHVGGCAACRVTLEQLRTALTDTVVSGPGEEPVAADVGTRVFAVPGGRYSSPGGLVELGRGGLGQVLLQRDHAIGRDVAVKVLNPTAPVARTNAETRFIREARLAGQLEHPGIVPLYDFGRDQQGALVAVMRRVGGRTFAATIAAAPSLEARLRLVPHVVALAQAVAYAHSRGVIHRDIKPQNVMVGAFGETLLLDWGLARVHATPDDASLLVDSSDSLHTRQGVALGTPAYMSPEQASGQLDQVDELSDLFALGAVLFEVITGRPPFAAPTADGALALARLAAVPSLRQLAPRAPAELTAITHRCLALDKRARYPNVNALIADLEGYLAGRRVSAYEYSLVELTGRLLRRYRVAVAAVVVALGVGGAAAVATHLRVRRERNNYRTLATFVLSDVVDALKDSPGGSKVIEGLAARVFETLREAGTGADTPYEDRSQLRLAISQIAEAQYTRGSFNEALASYDVALSLGRELAQERPSGTSLIALANDLAESGSVLDALLRAPEAEQRLDQAFETLAQGRKLDPTNVEFDQAESLFISFRVSMCERSARWDEGLVWAERGVALDRAIAGRLSDTPRNRFNAAVGYLQLTTLARQGGHQARARAALAEANRLIDAMQEAFPGTTSGAEATIESAVLEARLARDEGQPEARAHALARARESLDWLLQREPDNAEYQRMDLENRLQREELDGALEAARKALATQSNLEDLRPTLTLTFLLTEPAAQAFARLGERPELRGPNSALLAALTAALAGHPAEAVSLLGDVDGPRPETLWIPGLVQTRLHGEDGAAAQLVRALADEFDATDVRTDHARRDRAVASFRRGLLGLAADAGL